MHGGPGLHRRDARQPRHAGPRPRVAARGEGQLRSTSRSRIRSTGLRAHRGARAADGPVAHRRRRLVVRRLFRRDGGDAPARRVRAPASPGAPVVDWEDYDTYYTERYLQHPGENAAGYRASNVLTYAERLRAAAADHSRRHGRQRVLPALDEAGRRAAQGGQAVRAVAAARHAHAGGPGDPPERVRARDGVSSRRISARVR